jgi:predicted hotdog family 3-hydroxylacyl-ACP dehydratase
MYAIEQMIPHRGSMKLVQEIVEVGGNRCVTVSTALPEWPTCENESINPIVLVELVAQTAGVNFGWQEHHSDRPSGKVGWLVGIKKAEFFRDMIPVGTRIMVAIEESRREESYAVIAGRVHVDRELVAEVELQVFRPEKDKKHTEGIPS